MHWFINCNKKHFQNIHFGTELVGMSGKVKENSCNDV